MKNNLSHVEIEALAMLSEEAGETVQAIGKVLRFGWETNWKDGPTSRAMLQREVTDFFAVVNIMTALGYIDQPSKEDIGKAIERKLQFSYHLVNEFVKDKVQDISCENEVADLRKHLESLESELKDAYSENKILSNEIVRLENDIDNIYRDLSYQQ